ncbi:MAG: hypothetical protein JW807_05985 [Spirochaetes bacterium]|nr:hypothetical protein [Spirochaetota bacterium]
MKRVAAYLAIMTALSLSACSKPDYRTLIIGTWEWTGDACDEEGNCRKEIMTDDGSLETFTKEGLYRSKRTRADYTISGKAIYLGAGENDRDRLLARISSIRGDVMLLEFDSSIRRYRRRGGG